MIGETQAALQEAVLLRRCLRVLTKQIVDRYGALTEVRESERLGEHDLASLALGFEHGAVLVSAAGEDDTIAIRLIASAFGEDVSQEMPWRYAVGRALVWLWSLKNQQGYEDGLQLEFGGVRSEGQPQHLCVQLMVAASGLQICTVGEWLSHPS
jgi:hypothetical protein